MPPFVTQAAFAREVGVSKQAIGKAVRSRRIDLAPNGMVDLPVALARWSATIGGTGAENGRGHVGEGQPEARPRNGNGQDHGGPDWHTARAIRETWSAKLMRLEYEERSKKLVDADEVRSKAFSAGRRLRDRLLTMADRLATQVAATRDRAKCHDLIRDEVLRALEELQAEGADAIVSDD